MEMDYETIELQVRDYISPECSCKVEDLVNASPHVVGSTFDPVNNILRVKVHKGMASKNDIIELLKQCAVRCEQRMSAHEMAHMEHEAVKAKKPASHDHHFMMETEFKRHFLVATIFTIPVLILSPSIQGWLGYTLPSSSVWKAIVFLEFSAFVFFLVGFSFTFCF